ncbi:hypothetical protein B4109_2297 [Geobacillus stearothermophilus]|uniref:Uncharacterized protein n=1 Tax=Geobacillus stearothermophilus TaxID=1422 RepID=A0A150MG96_GEOSE|nr:hypothetical protein B4109_2297 [Geobacillus stearothermophilus]
MERTNHSVRFFPAQLRPFDFEIARQHRPDFGDGDLLPFGDVRGAANDLHRLAFAKVNEAFPQFIRVRVRLALEHMADDDAVHPAVERLNPLDFNAAFRDAISEFRGGDPRQIDVLAQPTVRHEHGKPLLFLLHTQKLPQET